MALGGRGAGAAGEPAGGGASDAELRNPPRHRPRHRRRRTARADGRVELRDGQQSAHRNRHAEWRGSRPTGKLCPEPSRRARSRRAQMDAHGWSYRSRHRWNVARSQGEGYDDTARRSLAACLRPALFGRHRPRAKPLRAGRGAHRLRRRASVGQAADDRRVAARQRDDPHRSRAGQRLARLRLRGRAGDAPYRRGARPSAVPDRAAGTCPFSQSRS